MSQKLILLAVLISLVSHTLVTAQPTLIKVNISPTPPPGTEVYFYISSKNNGYSLFLKSKNTPVYISLPSQGNYLIIAGFTVNNSIFLGLLDTEITYNKSLTIKVTNIILHPRKTIKIEILDTQGKKLNSCLVVAKIFDKTVAYGISSKGVVYLNIPETPYLCIEVYSLALTLAPPQQYGLRSTGMGTFLYKKTILVESIPEKLTVVLRGTGPIPLQKAVIEGKEFGKPKCIVENYVKPAVILAVSFVSAIILYLIARRKI